jgi:signal transduction histidine kinase
MDFTNKFYFTKIFHTSADFNGIQYNFTNSELEERFRKFNLEKEIKNSLILTISFCLPFVLFISLSIYINKSLIRTAYLQISGLILDLVFSHLTRCFHSDYHCFKFIKHLRFFLMYINVMINWIFPVTPLPENSIRVSYGIIIYIGFLYTFFLDYNYMIMILVPILNSISLFLSQFSRNLSETHLMPEIIINFFYFYVSFILKRHIYFHEKNFFYQYYRTENYKEYFQEMIDGFDAMIISVKKSDIMYANKSAKDYFNQRNFKENIMIKTDDSKEMTLTKEDETKLNSEMKNFFNNFFSSLVLYSSFSPSYDNGKNLSQIIEEIFYLKQTTEPGSTKIGYFHVDNQLYFEIHCRNIKFHEELVELTIYDITNITKADKITAEAKFKNNFLAKIAHEFKTPLITITSLINKVTEKRRNFNAFEDIRMNLEQIRSLSHYTLMLISDIIQYSSDDINLRLSKTKINLKEDLNFCFNILKTLIECKENKSSKIETKLKLDEDLNTLSIFTDEKRLKQIILNFISNSCKFTFSGYIKLKAKILRDINTVEISVKDSGLGIKKEDQHLIFNENTQISLDKDYNTQGSGLGLSITKNIATSLNYEIGFKSEYGKGSKFFIRIKHSGTINNRYNMKRNSINFSPIEISKSPFEIVGANKDSRSVNIKNNNIKDELSELNINLKKEQTSTVNLDIGIISNDNNINLNEYRSERDSQEENNIEIIRNEEDFYKIVVVDDHKLVRENTINLINSVLNDIDLPSFEIVEYTDGIELLNALKTDINFRIKLILIDENMEYLNGRETVNIIRKLEENKKINKYFIVSVTAYDDKETKKSILSSGVDSIICKPCTKTDLKSILNKIDL